MLLVVTLKSQKYQPQTHVVSQETVVSILQLQQVSPRVIVPTQPSLLIVTYRPADSSAFPTSNKQRTHIPIVLYKYTYAALLYKAIDSLVLHRHILSTAIEARRYSLVLYRQIFSITIEAHRYSVVLYRPILALVKSSARYSVVLYRQILSITI